MGPQTDKHLPQSPFIGYFFQMTKFCFGVEIVPWYRALRNQEANVRSSVHYIPMLRKPSAQEGQCEDVGGGVLQTPLPPCFPAASSRNSGKTTLHWSPSPLWYSVHLASIVWAPYTITHSYIQYSQRELFPLSDSFICRLQTQILLVSLNRRHLFALHCDAILQSTSVIICLANRKIEIILISCVNCRHFQSR